MANLPPALLYLDTTMVAPKIFLWYENVIFRYIVQIQILEDQYEDIALALGGAREEARLLRDQQPEDYMQSIPFSDSLAAELQLENIASGGSSSDAQFESFIAKNEITVSPIAKDTERGSDFGAAWVFACS